MDLLHQGLLQRGGKQSRSDVATNLHFTNEELQIGQQSILQHGIVWNFHRAADMSRSAPSSNPRHDAHIGKMRFDNESSRAPYLVAAVYEPSSAHLLRVQSGGSCSTMSKKVKKVTCSTLRNPIAYASISGGLGNVFKQAVAAGANAFCDADLIVSVFADVASEGVMSLASPLEAAMCAAAKTAASSGWTTGAIAAVAAGLNSLKNAACAPLPRLGMGWVQMRLNPGGTKRCQIL